MNVLVISPHPDDETLGAGGTILKLVNEGHQVFWLNITNMKEEYGYAKETIEKRLNEILKVKNALGIRQIYDLKLKPAGLDTYPMNVIIQKIKEVFDEVRPSLVILPYLYDAHSDHKIVFEAASACTKAFRAPYIKTVLCMEIISETNYSYVENTFKPNYYVDISDYIDKKIEIVSNYNGEILPPPFPRNHESIKSLAAYRGSSCAKHYAEAFLLQIEIM